jgi:hypothetical protein
MTSLVMAAQQLDLLRRQRRAERRDGLGEAGLVHRDDVEVALDQDRPALDPHRVAGLGQAEQEPRLLVDRALGAVDVLGADRAVLGRLADQAGREPRDLVARQDDRADHALAEAIVEAAGLGLARDQAQA